MCGGGSKTVDLLVGLCRYDFDKWNTLGHVKVKQGYACKLDDAAKQRARFQILELPAQKDQAGPCLAAASHGFSNYVFRC
mmetsp:Transcript_12610/g.19123  ORF Transcript_12610/g.19123 Transcript_12610/m.19123 type:complete len:80 (-) Transcript_12610:21-260(-)